MSTATAKMATTASPLTPTSVPGASVPSRDPPRATRPSQPRPTTYTGLSPTTTTSAPNSSGQGTSPSNSQVPLTIPPRTSSQHKVPTTSTVVTAGATENRSERSKSVSGRPGGNAERRNDRDRERDREREREITEGGRTRRAPTNAQATPTSTADPQRRNSTSQRERAPEEGSRKTTNGIATQNGSRSRGEGSSTQSRTAQAGAGAEQALANRSGNEGERRDARGRKETRFGDYILGQTLGEGEFGKVKLGWRRDGGVQVAIKLIRRDTLTPHPNRLSKIYREISILRTLSHPNIVRLHEMVETERHIGIILEYASGGELFDFILTHRFLKDPPACRLFAQLVSGVGYLHKKGIVHRDLKLENLLLDRNRNIIITDFGFANVFDPNDELGEELENKLNDPEVVKELEKGVPRDENTQGIWNELGLKGNIRKRGDLMATSCGSPCYAAPELVVSDGLYTGRKVDVWSCGVILYAMLAGYLPFDDDPANPEGDNINLLYKYIVSTPLTFPEYVTPHARDLLRRILVPDPRKRADLFEVARHSWLSPFSNVVGLITSGTTTEKDIANTTVGDELTNEVPLLTRSASVREPSTTTSAHPHATVLGSLGARHGAHAEHTPQPTQQKTAGDNKRRTVQVEYVEPKSQTRRGEPSTATSQAQEPSRPAKETEQRSPDDRSSGKTMQVPKVDAGLARAATTAGMTSSRPSERPATVAVKSTTQGEPSSSKLPVPETKVRPASYAHQPTATAYSATTTTKDGQPQRRASTTAKDRGAPPVSGTNKPLPPPGGTNTRPNTGNSIASNRLPSRGTSYSRPAAPAAPSLATANAQGRLQQPKSGKPYTISNPIPIPDNTERISSIGTPSTQPMPVKQRPNTQEHLLMKDRGHKRANTVTGTGGGVFGRFMGPPSTANSQTNETAEKSPRASVDQGGSIKGGKTGQPPKTRRFSLLPPSFSFRGIGSSSSEQKKGHDRRPSRSASGNSVQQRRWDTQQQQQQVVGGGSSYPQLVVPNPRAGQNSHSGSEASITMVSAPATATNANFPPSPNPPAQQPSPQLSQTGNSITLPAAARASEDGRKRPAVLQKNRKFSEAYEFDNGGGNQSSGSSGAARRVMDFFRRRGVTRTKS